MGLGRTAQETLISEQASRWAKANRNKLARQFASVERYPGELSPVSVFMAGSPGAGKTETAKALSRELGGFLIIDPDELRTFIPAYDGSNAWLFQDAVSRLVHCVLDRVFSQSQSFLLDGTLASQAVADRNFDRCIKKGRSIQVIYVYQEPAQAWLFVQAREAAEGRRIPKQRFIDQFFESRLVVANLKQRFGKKVQVDVVLKNIDGTNRRYCANVAKLDEVSPMRYTRETVQQMLAKS